MRRENVRAEVPDMEAIIAERVREALEQEKAIQAEDVELAEMGLSPVLEPNTVITTDELGNIIDMKSSTEFEDRDEEPPKAKSHRQEPSLKQRSRAEALRILSGGASLRKPEKAPEPAPEPPSDESQRRRLVASYLKGVASVDK
jgi:hypothetical protein